MDPRPHLFIATPCYGGLVTQGYMQSVLRLMQHAGTAGFELSLGLLGNDALITRCRNTLLGSFMQMKGATHLLFIDSDISFQPDQVERLLQADRPVIAGMYPLKATQWDAAARNRLAQGEAAETAPLLYVGTPCPPGSPEYEIDADGFANAVFAGTGFMLIRRDAIEQLMAAYPKTRYRKIHAWPLPAGPVEDHYALFDCMIDPQTGDYLSEDYAFCSRWRAVGGRVWLDTRGRLTHAGSTDFHGDPAARYGAARLVASA